MKWHERLFNRLFPPEEPIRDRLRKFIYDSQLHKPTCRSIAISPYEFADLLDECEEVMQVLMPSWDDHLHRRDSVLFYGCIIRQDANLPLGHWRIL